jgi:cupin 2 domain-containing protein
MLDMQKPDHYNLRRTTSRDGLLILFVSHPLRLMISNLFAELPSPTGDENFVELLSRPGIRVERIVSHGHASPPGFWYDQPRAEWVLILQGEAALRFEDEPAPRTLKAGDFVDIAPHRRHRVEWTHAAVRTVWLAVHYG